MTTAHRFAAAVGVVLVVGCGQAPPVDCSPSAINPGVPVIPVGLTGQPMSLTLRLQPAVICTSGNPRSTSVATTVINGENQPIAHQRTAPTSGTSQGYSTTVTFTPDSPGVYYLEASFEPALGTARAQLQVLRDASDAGPALQVMVSPPCLEIDLLGAFALCRRDDGLTVIDGDGGVVLRAPARGFAASGDTAWWWDDGSLTRARVDADGGLGFELLDGGLGTVLAASANDEGLVVSRSAGLTLFDSTDGGVTRVERSVAPRAPSAPGVARLKGTIGFVSAGAICASAEDGGVACATGALQPGAGEANGLWLRTSVGTVAFARLTERGSVPNVTSLAAQSTQLSDSDAPIPFFIWTGRVVTVRADDLTLEAWPEVQSRARSVTHNAVALQMGSGQVWLYRRR